MRYMLVATFIVALLSRQVWADETPTVLQERWRGAAADVEWETIAPTTKNWAPLKKGATSSQIAEELAGAGGSRADVAKALDPKVKYDLLKLPVGPGQITYMAVPTDNVGKMAAVQFGVPTFGSLGGEPIPASLVGDAFEEIKAEAIANLRSAVEAACAMPGRPSTLRIAVNVRVLEIEATWNSAEVCTAARIEPKP